MTTYEAKIPPVTFESNDYLKAVFLTSVARSIYSGFYPNKGYSVLPYTFPCSHAVCFPDLPYGEKFWKSFRNSELKIGPYTKNAPIEIAESFTPKIKDSHNREPEWRLYETKFWDTFLSIGLLTAGLPEVSDIKVVPITFGTGGSMIISFNPDGRKRLTLSLRHDHPINCIADMIIKELLVLKDIPHYINRYEDRQAVGRFIMNEPQLIDLFTSNRKKYPLQESVPIDLQQESKKYLEKLGFAEKAKVKYVNEVFWVNGKKLDRQVSPQELKLFTLLWKNRNRTVSHDEVAKVIWADDTEEKYSPWAITKIVERLRKKLRKTGLGKEIIQTKRLSGYVLTI